MFSGIPPGFASTTSVDHIFDIFYFLTRAKCLSTVLDLTTLLM